MDQIEQSQVLNIVRGHLDAIAAAWHAALSESNPALPDEATTHPQLAAWADLFFSVLLTPDRDPLEARAIGVGLKTAYAAHPRDWIATQALLAQQLAAYAPAELADELRPRLALVLGEALGAFFSQEAETFNRIHLEELTTLGHELRTPLNAIIGFSRVILKGIDGPLTHHQNQDLTAIYNAGQRQLNFINDILDVTKRDAAKLPVHVGCFSVAALVGDVLTTLQPLIGIYGHCLEVRCTGDLGALQVNPTQLRWVLLNLLVNAARFARQPAHGVVTLEASREIANDKLWVVLKIGDNGMGMSPEQTALLFGKAASGEGGLGDDYWGRADLGLIATRRICQRMGGDITVESRVGEGTLFTLRLPVSEAAEAGPGVA